MRGADIVLGDSKFHLSIKRSSSFFSIKKSYDDSQIKKAKFLIELNRFHF